MVISSKSCNFAEKFGKMDRYDKDTTAKNMKQQVSKTLEAARKLKHSIIVNDPELFISNDFIMNLKKINNREEYDWAVQRVEELLPLVDDDTPISDKNSLELERLSNMVADYSDLHFSIVSKQ